VCPRTYVLPGRRRRHPPRSSGPPAPRRRSSRRRMPATRSATRCPWPPPPRACIRLIATQASRTVQGRTPRAMRSSVPPPRGEAGPRRGVPVNRHVDAMTSQHADARGGVGMIAQLAQHEPVFCSHPGHAITFLPSLDSVRAAGQGPPGPASTGPSPPAPPPASAHCPVEVLHLSSRRRPSRPPGERGSHAQAR
jgi:hypothetical protein